jgi:hypothetical protein
MTCEVSWAYTPRWRQLSSLAWSDKILCRPCLEAHPITAFTSEERQSSATIRKCVGSSGYLRTCGQEPHNFEQLRSVGGNVSAGFLPGSVVDLCETYDHIEDNIQVRIRKLYNIETQCETTTYCDIDRRGREPVWSAIVRCLNERDAYICPHMYTSDPDLQDKLRHSNHPTDFGLAFSSQVGCMYPDCDTTVGINATTDLFALVTERAWGT